MFLSIPKQNKNPKWKRIVQRHRWNPTRETRSKTQTSNHKQRKWKINKRWEQAKGIALEIVTFVLHIWTTNIFLPYKTLYSLRVWSRQECKMWEITPTAITTTFYRVRVRVYIYIEEVWTTTNNEIVECCCVLQLFNQLHVCYVCVCVFVMYLRKLEHFEKINFQLLLFLTSLFVFYDDTDASAARLSDRVGRINTAEVDNISIIFWFCHDDEILIHLQIVQQPVCTIIENLGHNLPYHYELTNVTFALKVHNSAWWLTAFSATDIITICLSLPLSIQMLYLMG